LILLHFGADYANMYDIVVETAGRGKKEIRSISLPHLPHSMGTERMRAENHTEVASNRISVIT